MRPAHLAAGVSVVVLDVLGEHRSQGLPHVLHLLQPVRNTRPNNPINTTRMTRFMVFFSTQKGPNPAGEARCLPDDVDGSFGVATPRPAVKRLTERGCRPRRLSSP